MTLYFENCYNEMRELAQVNTMEEANKHIKDFLDAHNYKSYYSRIWIAGEYITIDVGSHTEFFKIGKGTKEELSAFLNRG